MRKPLLTTEALRAQREIIAYREIPIGDNSLLRISCFNRGRFIIPNRTFLFFGISRKTKTLLCVLCGYVVNNLTTAAFCRFLSQAHAGKESAPRPCHRWPAPGSPLWCVPPPFAGPVSCLSQVLRDPRESAECPGSTRPAGNGAAAPCHRCRTWKPASWPQDASRSQNPQEKQRPPTPTIPAGWFDEGSSGSALR